MEALEFWFSNEKYTLSSYMQTFSSTQSTTTWQWHQTTSPCWRPCFPREVGWTLSSLIWDPSLLSAIRIASTKWLPLVKELWVGDWLAIVTKTKGGGCLFFSWDY